MAVVQSSYHTPDKTKHPEESHDYSFDKSYHLPLITEIGHC